MITPKMDEWRAEPKGGREVESAINLAIFIYHPILIESGMAVCQELWHK